MVPRESGNFDPEMSGRISGRSEAQVLRRDNGAGPGMHAHRVAGKGNAAPTSNVEIPWRTSRRLQEATLRLIKERDGGQSHSHASVKEEDDSRSTESLPAALSPKRRQWESEPSGEKQGDHAAEVPVENSSHQSGSQAEQTSSAAETAAVSVRFRRKVKRRRKAQFNDPHPFTQDENKSISSISSGISSNGNDDDDDVRNHISSPSIACNGVAGGKKVERTVVSSSGIPTTSVKLPQSCFDLLCSHVGLRGWRCYRSCIAGQAFCVYHGRESTPVAGICLYT